MRDRAQVVAVEENDIKVVPLISDVCINCEKSSCSKRGKAFSVSNPKSCGISSVSVKWWCDGGCCGRLFCRWGGSRFRCNAFSAAF